MAGTMNLRHGTVKLKDATGSPIEIILSPVTAGLSIQGLEAGGYEVVQVTHRGVHDELLPGAEKPITGAITVKQHADITDATAKTVWDVVMKTGAFAAGATKDPGSIVWTTDIEWSGSRNIAGAPVASSILLKNCRVVASWNEAMEGNEYQLSYTAYGTGTGNQAVAS